MKQLILFRHGKSDWNAHLADDHGRVLAKRGRKESRRMGQFLDATGQLPDRVLTSSAVRARTSVEEAADAGLWDCPVEVCDDLYEPTPDAVLARVRAADDAATRLLVAGHEPCWSATVGALIGGGAVSFPTAAMACVELDVERWADAAWGRGQLVWHVKPKLVKGLLARSRQR